MRAINLDSLPHLVNCLAVIAGRVWYGCWSRLKARWWGVYLGPGCSFIGLPHFRRHPNSRITIGADCEWRSSHTSNLIGINRPCIIATLQEGAEIEIGPSCGFSGTTIVCASRIIICENVRCGANTWITDTDSHWDDPRTRPNEPVFIARGVWLGANVSVLKGVTIGENTVVAAGSVVTEPLPPNVVAAGIPAKVLKTFKEGER